MYAIMHTLILLLTKKDYCTLCKHTTCHFGTMMVWFMFPHTVQARAGAVFEIREDVLQDNAAYKFQFDQQQVKYMFALFTSHIILNIWDSSCLEGVVSHVYHAAVLVHITVITHH